MVLDTNGDEEELDMNERSCVNCESNQKKYSPNNGDDKVSNHHLKRARRSNHWPSQSLPVGAKESRVLNEVKSLKGENPE